MSCQSPLLALITYREPVFGKCKIKFLNKPELNLNDLYSKYGKENILQIPCGSCEDCRKTYSKDWAVRLTLERNYWKYGYFITLTYDEAHNPLNYCDVSVYSDVIEDIDKIHSISNFYYKDIQKFLKLCRKYLGSIAYFGVSELGAVTSRLHYHLILFTNKEIDLINPTLMKGHLHYDSNFIKSHWHYGSIIDVALFEHYCGGYVAKYTTKDKIKTFMSRNIGKRYFLEHIEEIIEDEFVIYGNFGHESKVDCPKFFIQWFKDCCICFDELQNKKVSKSDFFRYLKMNLIKTDTPELINSNQNRIKINEKKRGG